MIILVFLAFSFSLTFDQAFELAKSNALEAKNIEINYQQSLTQKKAAKSIFIPSIKVESLTRRQDKSNNATLSSVRGENIHTGIINISQTLIAGGSNYHNYKIAKNLDSLSKLEQNYYFLSLQEDLASIFYDVLKQKAAIAIKEEQITTLKKRQKELRQRTKIGQSKKTDLILASSQLAKTQAELSALRVELENKKQNLQNLIGYEDVTDLKDTLSLESISLPLVNTKKHPLLELNNLKLEQAGRELAAEKSSFYPSLSISGNYFWDRPAFLGETEWDLSLTASWEIFNGGQDLARVRLKRLEKERQEYKKVFQKLQLSKVLDSARKKLDLKKNEVKKFAAAEVLAKSSYQEFTKEYRRGLVSNLDVLRSLEDYLQIKLQKITSEYEVKKIYYQVKSLAGVH